MPPTTVSHRELLARYRNVFEQIEVLEPPTAQPPPSERGKILFWNAERGKFPRQAAARLEELGADALLLCELDIGMARSGQCHTPADLADRLGCGYAFGVEFIELGLGDRAEQALHQGEENTAGLHGAAILSPHRLAEPVLVRLESGGAWYDGSCGERRIGGRIALIATLELRGGPLALVNVHLESHSDPITRADQVALLLEAIDRHTGDAPVLIGGDFNTSTLSRDWARGTGEKPVLPLERVLDPVPYEPLFEVMAAAGYDWQACNALGVPTQRTRPDGTPRPPLGKIDWFFSRGLKTSAATTIPAVDTDGQAISDHEILAVTVRSETRSG
jgi:endonuclease/exonuclease/phosphatase family metal-dependent hydrolase